MFFGSLSSGRFAFGFGEEFFGFDLVAAAVDGGDEVVLGEEVDEHGEVFVVHDDDGTVVVGHEFELHIIGVVDEFFLRHFLGDVESLEFFDERFAVLEKGIKSKAFGEGEFVFVGNLLSLGVGDDLGFVVVLEEIFELRLVEDDDGAVDDGDLVVVGHFEGDFGGEGLETFAV